MAYYAEINQDNIVLRVVVVGNENEINDAGQLDESIGSAWCAQFFGGGIWIKTSYHGNVRKNYAGPGFAYDPARDAFIPPRPEYSSWTLNETTCQWEAPISMPDDGKSYIWDEAGLSWIPRT